MVSGGGGVLHGKLVGMQPVAAQAHGGGFTHMQPLTQPESGPKEMHVFCPQAEVAGDAAHFHFHLLPAGVASLFLPLQPRIQQGHGFGALFDGGEISLVGLLFVKMVEQSDASYQGGVQLAEGQLFGGDESALLLQAQGALYLQPQVVCRYGWQVKFCLDGM